MRSYITTQFKQLKLDPQEPHEIFRLKIHGDRGETKWLNISTIEVEAIERLLAWPRGEES